MQPTTKQTFSIFWRHARRYPYALTLAAVGVVGSGILDVTVPWYYKRLIDTLVAGQGQAETHTVLFWTILTILLLNAGSWALYRAASFASIHLQTNVIADLSNMSYDSLIKQSYGFFTNRHTGSLVRMVGRFSYAFRDLAEQIQWSFLPLVVSTTGVLLVTFSRSRLAALVFLCGALFFIVANIIFSRWTVPTEERKAKLDSETTGILSDGLTNITTVKLFVGAEEERTRYQKATQALRRAWARSWQLNETLDGIQAGLMILIEFTLLYVAIRAWRAGTITVGDFVLFQAYVRLLLFSLWGFGRVLRRVYTGLAEATEMTELLHTAPAIVDRRDAKPLMVTNGKIEFKNVVFTYNLTRTILNHFNLVVEPGERIAFVGSSGAGKTTLTKLLFRFYDLDSGHITIDGQDIATVTQDSLHGAIALVPQEPILFHRTLLENIRYGKPEATTEEVIDAARKARCHDFIMELPEGYDTYVGERGVKLSGGERQRVAIARAILKNAPILVLDEATSSLDSESESLIQEALRELMRGKTVIVIAHRLSTIMEMDRIVVMENGQVVDMGSHVDLLKKPGIYKKLWEIQAGGFLPTDEEETVATGLTIPS